MGQYWDVLLHDLLRKNQVEHSKLQEKLQRNYMPIYVHVSCDIYMPHRVTKSTRMLTKDLFFFPFPGHFLLLTKKNQPSHMKVAINK